MLIAKIVILAEMTFCLHTLTAYAPRATHSNLSAAYNKVSRCGAIAIHRRRHRFPSSTLFLLLCILKRRGWRNGEEEVVNGRLAEWHLPLGFLHAPLSHQFKTSVATGRHNAFQQGMLRGQCGVRAAPGFSPPLG